jgi:hypothetical protein
MDQVLDISAITIKRALQPGDDVTALAAHIKKHGQKVPIAVNQNLQLIDGLRRIEALRLIGGDVVSTVICEEFDDVIGELERSRKHGVEWRVPSPKRAWEINEAIGPYTKKRVLKARHELVGKPQHSKMSVRLEPARVVISRAIGRNSISYLSESVHLWNLASNPDDPRFDLARELAERVEEGKVKLFGVRARLDRAEIFDGDVLSPAEQRQMLQAFITNLGGVLKAAQRMGPLNPKIPREEIRGYLAEVQALRRQLYIFTRTFEQETEK